MKCMRQLFASADPRARVRHVLRCQHRLLCRMLAAWPRRGRRLLHLRCGDGAMLEHLWECGFDVSAYEPDPELRLRAAQRRPLRAEVGGGAADSLPYDDDAFDYTVLSLRGEDDEAALREAWRVTARSILLLGWNSLSPSRLLPGWLPQESRPAPNWWRAWRTLKTLQPESRCLLRSTLTLPGFCQRLPLLANLDAVSIPLPLGMFMAVRADFGSQAVRPSLPLSLLDRLRPRDASALMEGGGCGRCATKISGKQ
ncbi:MAG: methyltransferase domain-containing protein [Desulfovibrionaceae bacterium]|nr:methyltransferase domain-containing protein [Desulfovibrionaceae bacterium]